MTDCSRASDQPDTVARVTCRWQVGRARRGPREASMDLKRLEQFVAVAEARSFSLAAQQLYVTQPALSRAIAALERELDTSLFVRGPKGVHLTPAGHALRESANRILMEAANLESAVKRATGRPRFRIANYSSIVAGLAHATIAEFVRLHPEVDVQVVDADFARGIEPIVSGEYDVALLRAPTALPTIEAVPLFYEPMRALLPTGHRLTREKSIRYHDIADLPLVTFPPSIPRQWGDYWLGVEHRSGQRPSAVYARTPTELLSAVAYRNLVAVLPEYVDKLSDSYGIESVEISDMEPVPAAVAYRSAAPSPLAPIFAAIAVDVARREVQQIPHGSLATAS
jgi:DNA-binding transcriptional LysR family regulator